MNKPKILIKIIDKSGNVKRVSTRRNRRVVNFLKANKFSNHLIYVKVFYEGPYYNDGVYTNSKDSIYTLKVFLEAEK